jgi:hypothetical protein
MKKLIFGVALAIIGILMMVFKEFDFVTTEKIVDLGPIQISKEIDQPIQWSSVVGMTLFGVGGVLIFGPKKRSLLRIVRD